MIFIGTCGFCESQKRYFQDFTCIELQSTFYRIVRLDTLKKLRKIAGEQFEFTFKVFQGITHPKKSPTWKKSNIEPDDSVGYLNASKTVLKFWKLMLEVQKILKSKVMVIQLPKSFKDKPEFWEKAERFFKSIERPKNCKIAVELRGWSDSSIKKFCKSFDVLDVTDPLIRKPVTKKFYYFRLHGKVENGRIDYKHKYTKNELKKLAEFILNLPKSSTRFVLFNNVFMKEDAKELQKIIKTKGS